MNRGEVVTEDISRGGRCLRGTDWERTRHVGEGWALQVACWVGPWGARGGCETGNRHWIQAMEGLSRVPGSVYVLQIPKRNNSQPYLPKTYSLVVGGRN